MDESMELLQSFYTPRLYYDDMRKCFTLEEASKKSLYGNANVKIEMMRQRYIMIQQRVLRQDFFRKKLVPSTNAEMKSSQPLTSVDALLGRSGVHYLLGYITQVEEGRYYLEDLTGHIPISLDKVEVLSDGYITENCIVVVEGEMTDEEVFQ